MPLSSDERNKLAHLVRRASFGARPDEWDEYMRLGLAATTQKLLHPETTPDNLDELLQTIGGNFVDFDTLDGVRSWWIFRMAQSHRPLEEKMTLFWHNHFATANYKVRNPRWMAGQIATFRQNALGSFRTMLQCMARDPAMLVWLDGDQNKLGAPNENFAREVMELFTMGVGSGYTEKDVQEAARCFTGWVYDASTRSFAFNPFLHDDGWKTVLGQSGNFHGDDVIDIIAHQPATAKFLATKLWKFFVSDEPPPSEIARIAKAYFASGFSVRAMLETVFTSPAFYDERARYARVKSPAEFVVGVIRTLDVPLLAIKKLPDVIESMGQDLLNPPNVAGWPGGRNWINTRTLLARVNFSSQVTSEMNRRGQLMERVRDDLLAPDTELSTPEEIVNAIWDALMPGQAMGEREKAALLAYVKDGAQGGKVNLRAKLPGLLSLVMGTPEYQMA
jgi:uncharacterized protein (DUF1800 family)